jgi:hypothetical protein
MWSAPRGGRLPKRPLFGFSSQKPNASNKKEAGTIPPLSLFVFHFPISI